MGRRYNWIFRIALSAVAVSLLEATASALPVASKWAHEDLTNHLAKMMIKAGEKVSSMPNFKMVLPESDEAKLFAADLKALKDTDGYAVRKLNGEICFVAANPKGHVNGVHRWLERNFEIIWPRPKDGVSMYEGASSSDIAAADCNYRDVPAFRLRLLGGETGDKNVWLWRVRNGDSSMINMARMSEKDLELAERYGMYRAFRDMYGSGHDMESRWFPREEFFKDHPEYWMLIDGKRWEGPHSNFCETNPDFVRAFSKSVEEKIRGLPDTVRVISINMMDQGLTCQCKNCLSPITLKDGTVVDKNDPAFRSTRFFIFFNEVAKHVERVRPGTEIMQFAYMHLAIPPKVKVEPNVILKFCPYPRNMRYGIVESKDNANWKARLDGWLENTQNIYLREYYFCGCIYYPRPIADGAVKDLRYCRDRGIREVYSDLAGRWDGNVNNSNYGLNRPFREFWDMVGMEAWTIGKLFWDPSLDPAALRDKYLRLTFGPAASDVAEFYRLLNESWYSDKMAASFCDNPFRSAAHYIVKKGIAKKCVAHLDAALSKADSPERREWIKNMRRILGDWIRESPNYITAEFNVPRLQEGDPGFDFGSGLWAKAAEMPAFKSLRSKKSFDRSGTSARIYSDGRAFRIGFDVKMENAPIALTASGKGRFPRGDKIELSFSSKEKGYYQFAFDCDGNRYEANVLDASWDCQWDLKIKKGEKGWKASVRIPFDALGFGPHVDPRIKFMPMITVIEGGAQGESKLFSWQGGIPHTPVSWGELNVAIE